VHIFILNMPKISSRTDVDSWCISIAVLWHSDYFANHFSGLLFTVFTELHTLISGVLIVLHIKVTNACRSIKSFNQGRYSLADSVSAIRLGTEF